MSVFSDGIEAIFASGMVENLVYRPRLQAPVTLKVIPVTGDETTAFSTTRIRTTNVLSFDVLRSALPSPSVDDGVTYDGKDYAVKTYESKDADKLIWTITCYPDD